MATKKHTILFEPLKFNEAKNVFAVYTDLTKEALLACDGVVSVNDDMVDVAGYLMITIDKRYDVPSVLADIKTLVEKEKNDA